MLPSEQTSVPSSAQLFATTHWSVVLEAGEQDSPRAADALARLCRAYWFPLYAYARRRGFEVQDAQDLTQEFFALLLSKNRLVNVSPEKGKFRSFLLASFNHFLADAHDYRSRLKRAPAPGLASALRVFALEEARRRSASGVGDETQ